MPPKRPSGRLRLGEAHPLGILAGEQQLPLCVGQAQGAHQITIDVAVLDQLPQIELAALAQIQAPEQRQHLLGAPDARRHLLIDGDGEIGVAGICPGDGLGALGGDALQRHRPDDADQGETEQGDRELEGPIPTIAAVGHAVGHIVSFLRSWAQNKTR